MSLGVQLSERPESEAPSHVSAGKCDISILRTQSQGGIRIKTTGKIVM
jgi:hypothetical protein